MSFGVISCSLLVIAFVGAGMFNLIGTPSTRRDFVRWGYPAWWCRVTGIVEIATGALIVSSSTRPIGLSTGAIIVAAAIITVVRHGDWSHVIPLPVFAILLALAASLAL